MADKKEELSQILEKYSTKLKQELGEQQADRPAYSSREYLEFKKENLPRHFTQYEKLCNLSEKIIQIKPDEKKAKEIQESIDTCHLSVTPAGTTSLSVLGPIIFVLLGLGFSILFPLLTGTSVGMFSIFVFLIIGVSLYLILGKMPGFLADGWRLRASNEMVLTIFYVVTYMRHTSNLEKAIGFAAEHLTGPISLDLKKVLWDVETEKYESVKISLDAYLETWKRWNIEFVESFHLIVSSLYESSETRRLDLLDRSLDVMLSETYEKMLHYGHNLKSPITMLNMLGIIMPILGLVILPLVASFMTKNLPPMNLVIYIAALYNVIIPLVVLYFSKSILSKRPTGYGESDLSKNPAMQKYRNINFKLAGREVSLSPMWFAVVLFVVFFLVGISPLLLHAVTQGDIVLDANYVPHFVSINDPNYRTYPYLLLGYISPESGKGKVGPYGLGATLLSIFVPLALGLSIGIYYRVRTKNLIKVREESKKLENEFSSALFQLGNRLGDGLPAEIAFGKVAEVMEGTTSGNFFKVVSMNIRKLGMSVSDAIFNSKIGAVVYYPSNIIESSMKVLIESAKKGPKIAAQALINVSRYIKEIHRVDERMKDLMADTTSSMKSQISFLTPVIAGVVVGIMSMVSYILSRLSGCMESLSASGAEAGSLESYQGIKNFFGDGVPTYYMQIIVGIYVIEIVLLLIMLYNDIQNGSDKLNQKYMFGKYLLSSTILYIAVTLIVMFIFNVVAASIINSAVTGCGAVAAG